MKDISKSFPGVQALDRVNIQVKKGSVHAIMGENGAGKSTLMKILFGQFMPDSGGIFLNGEKANIRSIKDAVSYGISMIYQELSPIKELSIAENVFVGRYLKNKAGIIDWEKMYAECQTIFDKWNLAYNPRTKIKMLKTADVQMIEILKAISFNANLVIMDEPTSSLSSKEVEKLFQFIRALKEEGITIIMITHKIDEVFQIADRVSVLRDGMFIGEKEIGDLTRAEIIKMMVGREMDSVFPKKNTDAGKVLLEVKNLNNGSKVKDVSFTLHKGEILGFAGIVGAGRTETMRSLFGLDPHSSGEIYIDGEKIEINRPRDAINHQILMATESRKDDGLVLCRSVSENILLPSLHRRSWHGFLKIKEDKEAAAEAVKKLVVKTSSLEVMANFLSGGNQQKLILCKWLMMNPKVLILDEPTRGIDVGAKWEIYNIIVELAKQGVGIIFVSSEMEEIIGLSDRVHVMCDGEINGVLGKDEVTQERIMNLASEVQ